MSLYTSLLINTSNIPKFAVIFGANYPVLSRGQENISLESIYIKDSIIINTWKDFEFNLNKIKWDQNTIWIITKKVL